MFGFLIYDSRLTIFKTLMRVELGRKPGKARKENDVIEK